MNDIGRLVSAITTRDATAVLQLAASGGECAALAGAVADLIRYCANQETTVRELREAVVRHGLALQGGNLCLWDLFLADGRWAMDRSWLSFLGITLDPLTTDTDAWESVVSIDGLGQLRKAVEAVRSNATDLIDCTFQVRRDDGGLVWLLLRGMVVERDGSGVVQRLAGTMLDVTRWRELEHQLRQSQKLESIGQLAAGIAHEINTPIQFIGDNVRFASEGFASLLPFAMAQALVAANHPDEAIRVQAEADIETADLGYLSTEVPRALEQTLEGIGRVATIVRAMKEFSHPGSVGLMLVDINHLIRNATVISRSSWKYVAELMTELDPALPPVPLAVGDFNQVLLNLIVNAAQAVEDAHRCHGRSLPGVIRIATTHDATNVMLRISDDGCGMPEDVRHRIYDPFFTTKEVGRGTGQGLTIAHAVIVDLHKGTIACESTVGMGTTFTITLPLSRPEA